MTTLSSVVVAVVVVIPLSSSLIALAGACGFGFGFDDDEVVLEFVVGVGDETCCGAASWVGLWFFVGGDGCWLAGV